MPGSTTSQQQQQNNNQQVSNPWAPAVNQLTQGLGQASNAYNQASAGSAATQPSQFLANMTPDQLQAFQQMIGFGLNTNPGSIINNGVSQSNTGTAGAGSALSSLLGFNPSATNNTQSNINAANQYVQGFNIPGEVQAAMFPAIQTANEVTLPGIAANMAGSGNVNSSTSGIAQGLVQQGLAEQAQGLAGQLENQAYGTGLNLASNTNTVNNAALLSALSGAGSLGEGLANTGTNSFNTGVNAGSNLLNTAATGGAGEQAANQVPLSNQIALNQYLSSQPYSLLNPYLQDIMGIGSLGGQVNSSGTSTTTSTPSFMSLIGGLLGAGGSVLGSKPGAFGGGSGVLGALG